MRINNSPWLTQLHHERPVQSLTTDTQTEVVIIGGGIAGITTLYFLLKHTNKKVLLVEGNKIAHGATGHNAGQLVAEFEKPLIELVKEYGMKKAVRGLEMVEQAWELVDEIFNDTQIDVLYKEFIGYGGYSEFEQLLNDIETEFIKSEHGLISFPIMIARESGWADTLPEKYKKLVTLVDQEMIDQLLDVQVSEYRAVIAQKKGVMNSALFTERLALWCLEHYADRVRMYEHSFVHGVDLATDRVMVITNDAKIMCNEVVLCTNGFENFYIRDTHGADLDMKFHHEIFGAVGYMTGFLTDKPVDYMANYYYEQGKKRGADPFSSDPYMYVTRRVFDQDHPEARLISIGGPEVQLQDREIYHREFDVAHTHHQDSVIFAQKHFDMTEVHEKFFWHGLMGYTKTGVRMVGREPNDERLMYNLGCNGVGILSSIMGSQKIAQHINHEPVEETIFDPKRN